jgi:hypothetical protein
MAQPVMGKKPAKFARGWGTFLASDLHRFLQGRLSASLSPPLHLSALEPLKRSALVRSLIKEE